MTSVTEAFHSFPQILHANTGRAQTISALLVLFAIIISHQAHITDFSGGSTRFHSWNGTWLPDNTFCGFHTCGVNAGSVGLL